MSVRSFCPRCGQANLIHTAKFCNFCGFGFTNNDDAGEAEKALPEQPAEEIIDEAAAPVEEISAEAPVEEVFEEAPEDVIKEAVEEEIAPAEEIIEEAPAEEIPAEEIPEDVIEEAVEEEIAPAEEIIEEAPAEEIPAEEIPEDVIEEAVEEEEIAPAEEIMEEAAPAISLEKAAEEAPEQPSAPVMPAPPVPPQGFVMPQQPFAPQGMPPQPNMQRNVPPQNLPQGNMPRPNVPPQGMRPQAGYPQTPPKQYPQTAGGYAQPKQKNTALIVVIIIASVIILALGTVLTLVLINNNNGTADANSSSDIAGGEISMPSVSSAESSENSGNSGASPVIPDSSWLRVEVFSDGSAKFIFENARFTYAGTTGSNSVTARFTYDGQEFEVGLFDFGGDNKSLQCSVGKRTGPDSFSLAGDMGYSYAGDQLTIPVDMRDFGYDIDFRSIGLYELQNNADGNGIHPVTFSASEVVINMEGSAFPDRHPSSPSSGGFDPNDPDYVVRGKAEVYFEGANGYDGFAVYAEDNADERNSIFGAFSTRPDDGSGGWTYVHFLVSVPDDMCVAGMHFSLDSLREMGARVELYVEEPMLGGELIFDEYPDYNYIEIYIVDSAPDKYIAFELNAEVTYNGLPYEFHSYGESEWSEAIY